MAEKTRVIDVVPYQPTWKESFTEIKAMIQSYIGDLILRIEHVGSTSVEGLPAKPIIDLDVVIDSYEVLPAIIERLAKEGYEHQGNLGVDGREAFQRTFDDGHMKYHLYVCPKDGKGYFEHIALRDYLRANTDARNAYGELKQQLAIKHRYDIDSYVNAKTDFVRDILSKAELHTQTINWKMGANGRKFIASFSGGKDSTLALYKAMQVGEALGLIVMFEEEGQRSRAHGMPQEIVKAQAESIGLPIFSAATSWTEYEPNLMRLLGKAKQQGAEVLVSGDIDVPAHGNWLDRVTQNAGLKLGMPLWEMGHREVVEQFIGLGFVTIIVSVNLTKGMNEEDLGRTLTLEYVKELEDRGIDPCGESGEFHTTVIDGPLFKNPIPVRKCAIIKDEKYAYLPLELDNEANHP